LKTGAITSTSDLFLQVEDEKTQKQGRLYHLNLSAAILTQWWCLVASNIALILLYWVMHVVLYRRTTTAIKMASLFGTVFVVVLFAVKLAAAGAIRSCKMATSSGFWSSPGHAALGDALCIASTDRHGHQNG
jgi:hypothetical protein